MTATASSSSAQPKTAIVLAAGNGVRLSRKTPLKPLLKVGGLTLIERTVLTLARAGIERFRIVVGAKSDAIVAAVKALRRLRAYDITFIECPDWHLGNGVSLGWGAAGLQEPFLVSMSDHVTDGASARALIEASRLDPHTPKLATDPDPANVFDLDDATKVQTKNGRIEAIGKHLEQFDQIDTGLFYFPAASGDKLRALNARGAHQVSDLVRALAGDPAYAGFAVVPVAKAFWQDVDTPAMAREAERRLLRSLVKVTDGPVSRYLNRPISLRVTKLLAKLNASPNAVTTFVFLLSLAAACLTATATSYAMLAACGILFHFASIIDGCDGELSRYMLKGSRIGAWYDTLTDNVRYAAFFAALGIHSYRHSGQPLYLWAVGLFMLLAVYFVAMMTRRLLAENAAGTHLVILAKTSAFMSSGAAGRFERVVWPLRFLVKQDVIAILVMVGLLFDQPAITFWFGLVGLVVMLVQVRRALAHSAAATGEAHKSATSGSFVMFLVGMAVLGVMLSRAPLGPIADTLSVVGMKAGVVFGVAFGWLVLNTFSLAALLHHEVGLGPLLHNRLVGEAINNLVPLAGVAGEPYKIRHLATFVPLEQASHAVVSDKLINIISGLYFFAVTGLVTTYAVELSASVRWPLGVLSAAAAGAAVGLSWVARSRVPARALQGLLRKLGSGSVDCCRCLSRRTFTTALLFNLAGRAASLLEIFVLLQLLHMPSGLVNTMALGAVLGAVSILFFVVPQGIGVAEAGVAGAFVLLGLPVHVGVAFALLRRGRILFWALVGLVIFAWHGLAARLRPALTLDATTR